MINIKYYVFLMVGIFLALGLGMMIGITLESQNIVENQQTNLIRQIEDRYISIRAETEQLKKEILSLEDQKNQLNDLSSLLLNELVRNRFSGLHVGVVTFSQKSSMTSLLDFLNLAGASVQYAVTVQCDTGEKTTDKILEMYHQTDDIVEAVIQELIYSMDYGEITPLIQEAEKSTIISRTGLSENPVDIILLIGQGISTFGYDNMLISRAVEAGIPVVAVENSGIEDSAMNEYRNLGISTVDHIDSIYGQLALASILSGNKGNFGFGSNAVNMLPTPLFQEEILSDNEDMTAITEEGHQ